MDISIQMGHSSHTALVSCNPTPPSREENLEEKGKKEENNKKQVIKCLVSVTYSLEVMTSLLSICQHTVKDAEKRASEKERVCVCVCVCMCVR